MGQEREAVFRDLSVPALRPALLAALAAAALPAGVMAADPKPKRVIVQQIAVAPGANQTPATALGILEDELTAFLNGVTLKQGSPLAVKFLPSEDFQASRLAGEGKDVVAYLSGGRVRRGETGADVVEHTVLIRPPPAKPISFGATKTTILGDRIISYEHRFTLAYALIVQAYDEGEFGVAAALAGRVAQHLGLAGQSPSSESRCVKELSAWIAEIGKKAKERLRPGARDTGGPLRPPRELRPDERCDPAAHR